MGNGKQSKSSGWAISAFLVVIIPVIISGCVSWGRNSNWTKNNVKN